MKITKIQPAVKTAGRYNIFVDEKYSFSLDENQLLDLKLKNGFEISEKQLDELKGESEFGKAYARALELILSRPRSEKEMADYAWRKKWEEELSDRVLGRLREKGYIDDLKFAQFWLRARTGGKPSSKRKISAELSQKGVKKETIDDVLKGYSDDQELEVLQALVSKKQSKYPDRQKFIAYLARQGYSFDSIKKVLDI
ncbi:MAG: RecX family transcriptional regulator [Candidatus Saccharibacteria bacterium]|nr:RecX family transcriptional regulator [Candidatus Saccharibacteria bacterium]